MQVYYLFGETPTGERFENLMSLELNIEKTVRIRESLGWKIRGWSQESIEGWDDVRQFKTFEKEERDG